MKTSITYGEWLVVACYFLWDCHVLAATSRHPLWPTEKGWPLQLPAQLEAITTLLIAEAQHHQPSGGLYLDSLANVVAMQPLRNYGTTSAEWPSYEGGVPAYQLNQVLDYIDADLAGDIKQSMGKTSQTSVEFEIPPSGRNDIV
jgi:hypothetical protein